MQQFWTRVADAIASRNLWLYVAAFEVAMTQFSPLPGEVRRPLINIAAGVIASAALLAVIALGWLLLLRHLRGLARVVAAVPVVMLAGVARGVTVQACLTWWDMSDLGPAGYRWRIVTSVSVVMMATAVGVLVRVGLDGHRNRLEHLSAEQKRLSMVLAQAAAEVRSDQSGAMATISRSLSQQLGQVRYASPSQAGDVFEQIATSVVRPLSHELAAAAPTWEPPTSATPTRVHMSRVWDSAASIGYIEPWGPALCVLVLTPSSLLVMGLPALILHVVTAVLVYLGLWVLRRAAPGLASQQPLGVRLVVISAMLFLACTPAAVFTYVYSPPSSRLANAAAIILLVTLTALLLSVARATHVQRRHIEAEARTTIAQTRWWVSRTRMVGWWQSSVLARALHGPVQSAIHTAALRVRAAGDGATAELVDSALADVRTSLTAALTPGEASGDLRRDLLALERVWRPLASIEHRITADAETALRADVVCAEITADVATEAVSNAVRHGGARDIRIEIALLDDRTVSLEVHDDGRGWDVPAQSPGLGTSQLQTCALRWDYVRTGERNILFAELPVLQSTSSSVQILQSSAVS